MGLAENCRTIALTQGQVAIVDEADYEWLSQWNWCAAFAKTTGTHYAMRTISLGKGRQRTVRMHREILGLGYGDRREGDHINLDSLDNRRINLRISERRENARNRGVRKDSSTGIKGVYFYRKTNKYFAKITVSGKHIYSRYFEKIEDATAAYLEIAKAHFGEFARA